MKRSYLALLALAMGSLAASGEPVKPAPPPPPPPNQKGAAGDVKVQSSIQKLYHDSANFTVQKMGRTAPPPPKPGKGNNVLTSGGILDGGGGLSRGGPAPTGAPATAPAAPAQVIK